MSATDIPEIMDYVNTLPKSRDGKFSVLKEGGTTRSSEPDLVLGELQTNEISVATNSFDRKNYTFLLKTLGTSNIDSTSIFNLVIKETSTGTYSYIIENRMSSNWYLNYKINIQNGYSGLMIFYSSNGIYSGKVTMQNGTEQNIEQRNSCPGDGSEDDNTNGDDSPGGGGSTGGGGDSGGDGGGITITSEIFCVPCAHPDHQMDHLTLECTHPSCSSIAIITHKSPSGGKTVEDLAGRSCDSNTHCASENDCEFGWNDDCSCKDEPSDDPNEDENMDVITLIPPVDPCDRLKDLLDDNNIKQRIQELKSQVEDLNQFSDEKGSTLYMNENGSLIEVPVSNARTTPMTTGYSLSNYTIGGIHLHTPAQYPMFSIADIIGMNTFFLNQNSNTINSQNIPVHILVTSLGVYALKIESIPELAIFNAVSSDADKLRDIENLLFDRYQSLADSGIENSFYYKREFLKFITNNINPGVELYEANEDLTGWKKQKLTDDNQDITQENCN